MKNVTVLFAVMLAVGLTGIQAQSCHKAKTACSKSKTASVETHTDKDSEMAAAKLASLDESIESRVCEKSGKVSYVRKKTCPASGNVSYASVSYDADLGQFVNISPSEKKACCDQGDTAGCCSKAAADKAKCSKSAKKSAADAKSKT